MPFLRLLASDLNLTGDVCVTLQPAEYMPDSSVQNAAWMGGAILAKVVFAQSQQVTRTDYDEWGPAIVHKK